MKSWNCGYDYNKPNRLLLLLDALRITNKAHLFYLLLHRVPSSHPTQNPPTWATSVPILVFLGLCVRDLGPMYATDVVRCIFISSNNRLIFNKIFGRHHPE